MGRVGIPFRRETTSSDERATKMDRVNPLYIPRNHKVEEALSMAVNDGDLSALKTILATISAPFVEILGRKLQNRPQNVGSISNLLWHLAFSGLGITMVNQAPKQFFCQERSVSMPENSPE